VRQENDGARGVNDMSLMKEVTGAHNIRSKGNSRVGDDSQEPSGFLKFLNRPSLKMQIRAQG